MSKKEKSENNFEKALEELEGLVSSMEAGDLSLENALQQFERGIQLTRQCQLALREAEQKVEILTEKAGQVETADFDPDK
jgi:exodeoxyribonuclease VII small subunit